MTQRCRQTLRQAVSAKAVIRPVASVHDVIIRPKSGFR